MASREVGASTRQIKTVSFAPHERDLLLYAEQHGPFSPLVKKLLRNAMRQGEVPAEARLADLLARLVTLTAEFREQLAGAGALPHGGYCLSAARGQQPGAGNSPPGDKKTSAIT